MAKLIVDQLIEEARLQTGLEHFDSDSYREGLDILVADLNAIELSEAGAERNRHSLIALLAARLKTTDYLDKNPQLLARPITQPVFVLGVPRTGTTLLSNLLACDPARRSPLSWEIDDPVPPATTATLYTDPRALARLAEEKARLAVNPEMGKYYRGSAIYPNECDYIMAHDFKALMLESRGKLPNYRDWLFSTDMTSAYQYHKRFLQLLQAKAPGVWNLKLPSHALWLDTLLATYPDARLVWTHRDPVTAVASFCSIIALAHRGFSGTADKAWIADNCSYQLYQHLNRIMDTRDRLGEERLIDVHYADMLRDPLDTMRKLYVALGDEFTAEAESAMGSWLDVNPQHKFGRHSYQLQEYGLNASNLAAGLERYLSRYPVAREN